MAKRVSGVLLHPTSLPGPFGIGDLGGDARVFLTWLQDAGQSAWQVLPLGPVGLGNSPYDASSTFAGNPLLISPDRLRDWGLLTDDDLLVEDRAAPDRVDFPTVVERKSRLLRAAWRRFEAGQATAEMSAGFEPWIAADAQAVWLEDWTLYAALRAYFGESSWLDWPQPIRRREPEAIDEARGTLSDELRFQRFAQFVFFLQWSELRAEAHRRGIRIVGDLPFYVALDSCDVWAHPELFDLDDQGRPRTVAGVPPDYFSPSGQRWGNPIYRWSVLESSAYRWWLDRIRFQLGLVDWLRLDHFRAFAGYWEVAATEPTAERGRWRSGPGDALFEAAREEIPELPLIAEDLGSITDDVEELRRRLEIPGMAVLQFAFDSADSPHLPHNLSSDTVLYTGTHDNDTVLGWLTEAPSETRRRALVYVGGSGREFHWDLIRVAQTSVADTVVVPAQDILGLDGTHRMNRPGTTEGNWQWRLAPRSLTSGLAERLGRLSEVAGRLPGTGD